MRVLTERIGISALGVAMVFSGTAHAARSLSIPQIQGSGVVSAHVGRTVKTQGVVTAIRRVRGDTLLYVQDPVGDNDPATSDGIVVSVASAGDIKAGDLIEVEGQVSEVTNGANSLSVTSISPAIVKKKEPAGDPGQRRRGDFGRSGCGCDARDTRDGDP
ncbi:hypothetical protein [Shinella sp.]|uniref:hypothetical protein n=1 Tax=Shinella sp. TaxID=1870904 RepID=UPI003F7173F4